MSGRAGPARRRARLYALALAVIVMPSSASWVLVQDAHPFYTAAIVPSDLAMVLLAGLSLPELVARMRRPGFVGSLAVALVALLGVAFAVHPATQGVLQVGRVVGAIAVIVAAVDLRQTNERRFLLFAIACTAVVQTAVAIGELLYGDLLALYPHEPVLRVGPFFRPNGTLPTAFILAGFALVSASLIVTAGLRSFGRVRLALAALAGFAFVPVGLTFSRAAAAGYVLGVGVMLPGALRGRDGRRLVLAAILVGGMLPAFWTLSGWTARNAESPVGGTVVNRVATVRQALPLIAADPLFGVGPGRTAAALRELEARAPGSVVEDNPPHNVPAVVALEAGVPAGLVALALIVALGIRARRSGTLGLLCYAVLLPYVLVDNWPYATSTGLITTALWAVGSTERD